MKHRYFVTGIGTDVGKTVVSAILCSAYDAAYWKPVQSGTIDGRDSETVKFLTPEVQTYPERYLLKEPLSPHAAAERENISIDLDALELCVTEGNLIVEGAGGILVPINSGAQTYADCALKWGLETIVVSRHYLGSINHTLLTIDSLKSKGIRIKGRVFVGEENRESEDVIMTYSRLDILGRIPLTDKLTPSFIREQAKQFRSYELDR